MEEEYEPPMNFDRDVRFGLTPAEWFGLGLLSLTAAVGGTFWWMRAHHRPRRRLRR